LRRALDDLEKTYNTGSDDWKKNHKGELDARRDHINQKLAALAETVSDLNALTARMQNVRNWLDSLRTAPGGGLRSGVDLFDPQVFVRLGSISLYLRGMGADAFGLTSDAPFRVVVPQMQPQQPQLQKASLTDEEIEQKFNEEMERMEQRARELDAIRDAPETEVDPDFDAWLNNPG
jgi:hypothetical protein